MARYWPEFAANGKSDVRVRHLLSHTSGVSGWQERMTTADLYDWEKATRLLAAQAPWWEPGTASGYHALNQGFLVGEVVRRITGTTLGTFFRDEIATPLGADFHIGLAPEHDARVARVILPQTGLPSDGDSRSIARRTLGNPPLDAEASWSEGWRRAEIAAVNGHGNARSVATIQSVLACGGTLGGRRVLSAPGCEAVFAEQSNGADLVLGVPVRFGLGYGLRTPEMFFLRSERSCFWGGWGGSLVVVDCAAQLVVAYLMNRMGEGTLGDVRGVGSCWRPTPGSRRERVRSSDVGAPRRRPSGRQRTLRSSRSMSSGEFGGTRPGTPSLPYASSGGTCSFRCPPTFIVETPSSIAFSVCPFPRTNSSGWLAPEPSMRLPPTLIVYFTTAVWSSSVTDRCRP